MSQESLSPIARGRLCKTTEIFVRIENVFFLFNIYIYIERERTKV